MADAENSCAEEEIEKRHRKERKDIQANIQKLKYSIPKGDKKKKKDVTAEIARLEAELDERHEKELQAFKLSHAMNAPHDKQVIGLTNKLSHLTAYNGECTDQQTDQQTQSLKKPSKAQKRKEKKAAQDKEREENIKAQELLNLTGARNVENVNLKEILSKRNLAVHDIPADGNCLYGAIEDQLTRKGRQISMQDLRYKAADYMLSRPDEFMPFLTNPVTDEPFTEEDFKKYCDEMANIAAWGSQLEIKALSDALQTPVEVVQSDAPTVEVGEEYTNEKLTISYHRHIFGLGGHYNSVIEKPEEEVEDGFS